MGRHDSLDRFLLIAGFLATACTSAHAYIDPGTASAVWVAGLAPLLAFIAYIGRKIARMLSRGKNEGEGNEQDTQAEVESEDPEG